MNKEKNKVDFRKNLGIYIALAKPYKAFFIGTAFFVFLVAFAKVFERYLFKELIDQGTLLTAGSITQETFFVMVIYIAIAFVITATIHIISDWLRFHLINKLEIQLILDLKEKFFNHIIELSHRFHTTHRTGSLIARLTRGARAIEGVSDFFVFETLPLSIEFVIVFIAIIYFDFISAMIILGMVLAFIVYSTIILGKQQRAIVDFNRAEDIEKAHLSDSIMNIETIKYFGKHNYMKAAFFQKSSNTKESQWGAWKYSRWLVSGHGIILSGGLVLLMISPILRLANGELSIGTIVFFYTIYVGLVGPLGRFTWHLRNFYNSMADFDSLTGYADIENEIKDKSNATKLKIKKGSISFKNISFSYNQRKIIKKLDLDVKAGERIALVGHSGSGKTTIVKLLYRLYDLNKGSILIDGKNITNVKQESLRSEMSIVPQEGILFNDTIENNIKFSKPSATKKEVVTALKQAQFYKFVKSLPDKEQTMVGERGIKLSGGEKQRLSIARAILANKKILVLDEATSALDSKTEVEIQKALVKLMQKRTSIIIAHRLSTIMHSDKIVVMDQGKIVQMGKHKELIRQIGPYKELWKLQKGGYIE
ncbi:MAG: ABC transporter ATP-binding protein [Candidatus Diapherotrites archaeon]|jgi:ATP-binding cassette, subfamily B, heavy metal transporter|uniref:ABC transporter ATP-binding protein n=1 Tax=Candidatus Iainarchaeum sp. TaxID=3101447 RepID=A0A8T5GFI4_9ARCH|nr:ABC transporter ATP-binding protein [Candidatus Diapherotrites archaeon]MBT7241258.1 ABC transporter ATP-binding protein [Candidatus Diapherotrites archaeon]